MCFPVHGKNNSLIINDIGRVQRETRQELQFDDGSIIECIPQLYANDDGSTQGMHDQLASVHEILIGYCERRATSVSDDSAQVLPAGREV